MIKKKTLTTLLSLMFINIGMSNDLASSQNITVKGGGPQVDYEEQIYDLDDLDLTTDLGDFFATSLSTGDYNNDGIEDLAIGIPYYDINIFGATLTNTGAVIVVFGDSNGLDTNDTKLLYQITTDEAEENDRFGSELATGDFDGDGIDDLAVGIPREDVYDSISAGEVDAGAVNIFYGHGSDFGEQVSVLHEGTGSQPNTAVNEDDHFGGVLASGDFNGDGFDDLAVGIPNQDFGTSNSVINGGQVNIYYGSNAGIEADGRTSLTQNTFNVLEDTESGDLFGWSLAAGDFTGDGRDDLAVGVPGEDVNGLDSAGIVQVFNGSPASGVSTNDKIYSQNTISGTAEAFDEFGNALSAGDINGDGVDDLLIGVWKEDLNNIDNVGAAQILYGQVGAAGLVASTSEFFSQRDDAIVGTEAENDRFGNTVLVKDLNNDGYAEAIIGSPADVIFDDNANVGHGGGVNVLFGSESGITFSNDKYFTATELSQRYGEALAVGRFSQSTAKTQLTVGIPMFESMDGDNNSGAIEVFNLPAFDLIFENGFD
jgi:hypothetical protein